MVFMSHLPANPDQLSIKKYSKPRQTKLPAISLSN